MKFGPLAAGFSAATALANPPSALLRDPALDIVAARHLAQITEEPRRATRSEVLALLRQQGESAARWRPVALLGPATPAREAELSRRLSGAARSGFTHFGVAADGRGVVAVLARRPVAVRPPVIVRTPHGARLQLAGWAPPGATLTLYRRGPCPRRRPCRARPLATAPWRRGRGFEAEIELTAGGWTVELTADVGFGPEVATLTRWWVGPSGARRLSVEELPDRRKHDAPSLSEVRRRHDVDPVVPTDPALVRAAEAHARTVCQTGWAKHRVDGAGPDSRARAAGYAGLVTEVVAVDVDPAGCWRRLEASPAHLAALLVPAAASGIGITKHEDRACLVVLLGR